MAAGRHEMHQRPQPPIAHPVVIVRDVAFAQRAEHDLEARRVAPGRHHQPAGRPGLRARPCDPESSLVLEQAQKGAADTADGGFDSLLAALVHNPYRRAIGHYDQAARANRMRLANSDQRRLG